MKSTSKKLLESAIATLHTILDAPGGQTSLTTLNSNSLNALDVVNEVLKPNTEGFYIVAATANGKIDGFFISRKPAELPAAETPAETQTPDAEE